MRVAPATILPLGLLLTACGQLQVRPSGAERSIIQVVESKTGTRPTRVSCPSGVAAKVGGHFDCHFVGPHQVRYVAHMRITGVKGDTVDFYINTELQ